MGRRGPRSRSEFRSPAGPGLGACVGMASWSLTSPSPHPERPLYSPCPPQLWADTWGADKVVQQSYYASLPMMLIAVALTSLKRDPFWDWGGRCWDIVGAQLTLVGLNWVQVSRSSFPATRRSPYPWLLPAFPSLSQTLPAPRTQLRAPSPKASHYCHLKELSASWSVEPSKGVLRVQAM